MNLEETIKIDIKKSMISRNPFRTTLLRTIIGEFNRIGKNIDGNKCISIIKKMKENAEFVNNTQEIDILNEYLPTILSEEETISIVNEIFKDNEFTMKDMGTIMKTLKTKYGQSMNMKTASITVKKLTIMEQKRFGLVEQINEKSITCKLIENDSYEISEIPYDQIPLTKGLIRINDIFHWTIDKNDSNIIFIEKFITNY